MDRKILTTFLAALLSTLVQVSGLGETYRGSVVEYHPVIGKDELDTMTKNAANYVEFMKEAHAKGADIIVFPESGLYTKITSAIPDPAQRITPCDSDFKTRICKGQTIIGTRYFLDSASEAAGKMLVINKRHNSTLRLKCPEAVKDISCASKDNQIYTVINLPEKRECEFNDPNCPKAGFYVYNTNVAFDRTGMVIARYAKYNLFTSDAANKPPLPEISFFDTDFGVRFGTFVCFDLIFWDPTLRLVQQFGITDFVFTTYWFGELPFLTGLQAQRGWAEANNVNLLASGVDVPETGSAGSGIYNGKYGNLVQIMPEKTTSKLLVADVPKIKVTSSWARESHYHPLNRSTEAFHLYESSEKASEGGLQFLKNPILHKYVSEIIKPGQRFEKTICGLENFCCDFVVNMDALKPESQNYTYRAMVFNGIRPFGAITRGGVQSCAIVVCHGTKQEDCGNREKNIPNLFRFKEILIKGKFKLTNSFQIPSTLTDGEEVKPLPANRYKFVRKEEEKSIAVSLELVWPVLDLHTFAIWGRDFTRDNLPEVPESGAAAVSAPVLFISFMAFLLFFR